jgi:hypothetical protein
MPAEGLWEILDASFTFVQDHPFGRAVCSDVADKAIMPGP